MKIILSILLSVLLLPETGLSQHLFLRVEADFTTKEKLADGTSNLTMGKVYFDQELRQMVFDIQFPEPVVIITTDSFLYRIKGDSLVDHRPIPNMLDFTVLSLCLRGNLPNFGLETTPYKMTNVSKEEDMILATWSPPKELRKTAGEVIISQKDKQLYGLVSLDPKGEIIGRQFYRKYETVNGLPFPTEIIAFSYPDETEIKQLTTYRNILVNQMESDAKYAYPLPDIPVSIELEPEPSGN